MITQPNLGQAIKALNALAPEAGDLKLGNLLTAMISSHNQLISDHNALQTKYVALLAHMDSANVAALGTAHAATYGAAASTASAPSVGSL
jgi:hypothetical protein